MGAGESARREYDRRLQRHKILVRRTLPILAIALVVLVPVAIAVGERFLPGTGIWWGVVVGLGLVKELWPSRAHVDAWATGAVGEEKVGRGLEKLGPEFIVLHDRRIPGSKANIDHLVVGPTGVFIVETKNVAGKVVVANGQLRVAGRRREYGSQAWREAMAVQGVLAPKLAQFGLDVRPLLCFTKADLPWGSPQVDGVPLLYPREVVRAIQKSQASLSDSDVRAMAEMLHAVLKPA
jgi:hypothetical protein